MFKNHQKFFGVLLAAFSIFIWGVTFVCTKYLLRYFSSLEILFYRFAAAYAGLWILHPKYEKIEFKDNIFFALAGLSGVVLYQLFENIAIHFTNASNVSVIVSICPLFTAVASQIFLKEKHISFWFIIGFIISIIGVTLVCLNGDTALKFNPKGDLLALSSGICWGFYSVIVSILNRRKYNLVCMTRRIFFYAVIMMIPLSLIGMNFTHADGDFLKSLSFNINLSFNTARFSNIMNVINMLFLGVVASGICFTMWNKASNILGTVNVNCGIYLIPVVTIVFAFFVLGEKITLLGFAGAVITITGLFISEKKSSGIS